MMALRVALVVIALAVAYGSVRVIERRPRRRPTGLGPGLTVITGPDCTTCTTLTGTLVTESPDIDATILDIRDDTVTHLGIRSLPTVFVVDQEGAVLLRRSGRSTLTDFHQITTAARRAERET